MKLIFNIALLGLLISQISCEKKSDWGWGEDVHQTKQLEQIEDTQPSASGYSDQEQGLEKEVLDENEAEEVIDTILTSTRQGRNLEGYDEVYADPTLQEAIQKGDDTEARNIIKDRLCSLGLMQCDGFNGKRPYISPEELQYAQPVAINPVGRPIPTIPLKGGRPYGPPKSVYPNAGKYPTGKYPGPIPRPPRPTYAQKPTYQGPPNKPNFIGPPPSNYPTIGSRPPPFSGPVIEQPSLNFKPNKPYEFDRGFINEYESFNKDKKVEVIVNGAQAGGVQQHVHHHFHHGAEDGAKIPLGGSNNLLSAATTVGGVIASNQHQFSVGSIGSSSNNGFNAYKESGLTGLNYGGQPLAGYGGNNFNQASSLASSSSSNHFTGLGGFNTKPVVENQGPQTFNSYQQPNSLYSNSFGTSVGSYGNTNLYKKEFDTTSNIQNNYLQGGYASGNKYTDTVAPRENYDCVCVPYDQCPNDHVIGRKDDLFLPLDPRNLKSDIEAEEERVITDGNGTMTTIRVTKDAPLNATVVEEVMNKTNSEGKKISKREAPVEKDAKVGEEKAEARQNYAGNYGQQQNNKIKPTFGLSFGLPNQGFGGYPINPYGPNPLINPYGGAIGGYNGINLGLLSVNPLVSVQLSKDDYGGKVIKPFVNLHVTPNDFLLNKFHDFFAYKKGALHNTIHHHHYNKPYHHHRPHYGPPIHEGPYREYPEHYAPHFNHDGPIYEKPHHFEGPHHIEGPPHHIESPPHHIDGPPHHIDGSPHHIEGPPHHFEGPIHYEGPPHLHRPPPHFGHYEEPFVGGGESFFGRSYTNTSNVVSGNNIFNQYKDQFNKIPNSYGYGQYFYGNQNNIKPTNQNYGFLNNQQNGLNNVQNGLLTDELPFSFPSAQSYDPAQYELGANSNNNVAFEDDNANFQNSAEYDGFGNSRGGKSLKFSNSIQRSSTFKFPSNRRKRDVTEPTEAKVSKRQAFYQPGRPQVCGPRHVCCRRPLRPQVPTLSHQNLNQCGTRHSQGINGRIKNPVYVDGDSEFGEYPWQVAILKKDPKESVYACGGTLIDALHIITAAHCIKTYTNFDLRVRLGEWDVNHDVEFYPYIERDVTAVNVHPEFYAGTLYNDIAVIRMDKPVDFAKYPHISPACLPSLADDYTGARCWTTGWGKDAFGDFGKYQNILKEVDVPIVGHAQCQQQLRQTRLGYDFKLHPGFVCAGGEEGKDACKGDGGGPMVCERGGSWQVVGVVSWGIGCGQYGVPGVYVKVAHYLDWIRQIVQRY